MIPRPHSPVPGLSTHHQASERVLTVRVDTVYLLNGEKYRWLLRGLDAGADLLGRVDGFAVLVPGWRRCAGCQTTTEVPAVR